LQNPGSLNVAEVAQWAIILAVCIIAATNDTKVGFGGIGVGLARRLF